MKRTLIIEDDQAFAEYLSRAIGAKDTEIVGALKDAINLMAERSFDMIICDLGLPDSLPVKTAGCISAMAEGAAVMTISGRDEIEAPQSSDMHFHKSELGSTDKILQAIAATKKKHQARPMFERDTDCLLDLSRACRRQTHAA